MPKKKTAAAPAQIPTKDSFFQSKRTMVECKKPEAPPPDAVKPAFVRPRRYLFEEGTGVAYAEVLGDDAICLETGQVLFRFGGRNDDEAGGYQGGAGFKRRFDFSPPMGKRHPDDMGVDVLNMVKAGILTNEDVASQKAFTREELVRGMETLEAYCLEWERKFEAA
jgi:hypothetical protein